MNKIKYHFFGKECLINRDLSDFSDLEKNLQKINFNHQNKTVFVNQIHSNQVLIIDKKEQIQDFQIAPRPKADGIITNLKNLPIGIITADCLPILFFDQKNSVIAAIHSGWRGAKNNIISEAIKKMLLIGAKINNIHVLIGPSIRQKSYEISEEFYQDFINEDPNNADFFIASKKPNHFMFDLISYCKRKILQEKIANIIDDEIDTYSNPDRFFSYRRSCHLNEKDCGHNISLIMIE